MLVLRCPSTNAVSTDKCSQFMVLKTEGRFSHVDLVARLQSELSSGFLLVITLPMVWWSG